MMGILNTLFKQKNNRDSLNVVVSPIEGIRVSTENISDSIFSEQMMGQTIAFKPSGNVIVSPANGILEVMYPTGHAFAVRMPNGVGLLVHIGLNTVNLNGKGFEVLAEQGSRVKAGQPIVNANLKSMEHEGVDTTTMLIVTDLGEARSAIEFSDEKNVRCGQVISI